MDKQDEEKAREYLLKDHISPLNDIMHISDLRAEMQYHKDIENAFKRGCLWKKEQLIEKASEWLRKNKNKYIRIKSMKTLVDDSIIEDFKRAMEE